MTTPISLTVYGDAQPAGSKKAYVVRGRAHVVEANAKAMPWKQQVGKACAEQYGGPFLEGALAMEIDFYAPRPRSHYGSGKNANVLKDSSPLHPTVAPDIDKLTRAILDGLQGQMYRNDSQVVAKRAQKHYGEPARVEVTVTVLRLQTVADQLGAQQLALAA